MKSLGKDELELVSKKLTVSPDYTRFRSVCKSWRSAAPKHPHLPWLIARHFGLNSDSETRTKCFKFYQLSFETNKFVQIPEVSGLPLSSLSSSAPSFLKRGCTFYSHGWISAINPSTSTVSLFNPLTNSTIHLPALPNLRGNDDDGDDEEMMDDDSDNDVDYCFVDDRSINFFLTSDPGESLFDCFALVYHRDFQRLYYCKIGCTDWIEMQHPIFYGHDGIHICCYRLKTFIASYGDVFVCDFGLSGCNPSVQKISSFCQDDTGIDVIVDSWLVESDGDLLLVLHKKATGHNYNQVFKLEFGGELTTLVELKSLGDKALFLSPWTTFSLTASMYPGCKANSIYSTHADVLRDILKLSNYDFEKRRDVTISDNHASLLMDFGPCGWFTPSLLK